MKPELRRLHSPDVPDLESFRPADADFGILVQAFIGPAGAAGEESFDFVVCTPEWLSRRLETRQFVLGRNHLIVHSFDFELITRIISSLCNETEGPTWSAVAARLARYGRWEFDDYRGYRS